MSTGTGIEWTDVTWNPVVGCTRASAGCDHCYAVTMTHRLEAMGQAKYAGLTVLNNKGDRHFNGVVRTVPEALTIPLHWRKPRMIFVNSMSDLFHKDVPFEFIDRVFAVMALCPQHTFQVLTKRPERMAEYLTRVEREAANQPKGWECNAAHWLARHGPGAFPADGYGAYPWPLSNVWLGTSVENQATADERIPQLLRCPAAVRFVSAEPLLAPIRLDRITQIEGKPSNGTISGWYINALRGSAWDDMNGSLDAEYRDTFRDASINWVIVGGESGPGARPCNIDWIRGIVQQCQSARVPAFVKQLGAKPWSGEGIRGLMVPPLLSYFKLTDPKGGNESEWPEDLRVREFPASHHGVTESTEVKV